MNQPTKHYRCAKCRKLVTVAAHKTKQPPQITSCPKCHTRLDEHDEVVRMIRSARYHPAIRVC